MGKRRASVRTRALPLRTVRRRPAGGEGHAVIIYVYVCVFVATTNSPSLAAGHGKATRQCSHASAPASHSTQTAGWRRRPCRDYICICVCVCGDCQQSEFGGGHGRATRQCSRASGRVLHSTQTADSRRSPCRYIYLYLCCVFVRTTLQKY